MEEQNSLNEERFKDLDRHHRRGKIMSGLLIVGIGSLFLAREIEPAFLMAPISGKREEDVFWIRKNVLSFFGCCHLKILILNQTKGK